MIAPGASALAWRVEHACFKAWPALDEIDHGGWRLRFGDGLTRRANSVNPLRADPGDIAPHLDRFAAEYAARDLPLIVRVPSCLDPANDATLDRLGFVATGESCALAGDLAGCGVRPDAEVGVAAQPGPEWFAAMARLQNQTPGHTAIYRRIVDRVAAPAGYAWIRRDGETVAVAFGALHEDLFCCESVVVDSTRRGQGLGRRLMRALYHHAQGLGAQIGCLQVEASNVAGRALYRSLGLGEVSRYHYRQRPLADL